MINFYIPDFFYKFNTNIQLLKLINEYPDIFYDDFKIGAVFGNFPNCIWNGGGTVFGRYVDYIEQYEIMTSFYNYNVPLRLTMTNPILEKKHLFDSYANYIMENMNNGFNQILVASPILEEYIRTNYPKYPIVRSILAAENIYYDDSDKYYMSVLRKHKNNDLDFLKSIKNKNKIEILINETCDINCPKSYTHYNDFAKKQLYMDNKECVSTECLYDRNFEFKKFFNSPLCINREKIKTIYEPLGFNNFKISGRGSNGTTIFYYAHYMVKPEWHFDFFNMMLEGVILDNR